MMAIMESCDLVPVKVIGVDIDIREHNKDAIKSHPSKYITMIEGSSIDVAVDKVKDLASQV